MAALKINPADSNTPPKREDAAQRRTRWRKAAKRLAWGLLGLLGILLVVFLLLPVWISNEQGRTYVLQQINARMQSANGVSTGAKLAIEDWSLGWFHGTQLKNVTLSLPDGTRLLSCPKIDSDLTLWGIVWSNFDVGNTRIDTAQIRLIKNPDGTTSLDSLAGLTRIFRTLRGSLQIGSAAVTLNSLATGQSLTYTDLKADITIASSKAPFHVQITAVGAGGSGAGEDQTLSYNATLPAISRWPAPHWALLADTEFTAFNLPTALTCDWLGLDPRWNQSLGDNLERVRWSCHVVPPMDASRLLIDIKGTGSPTIQGAFLLQRAAGAAPPVVTLPNDPVYHALASLKISPPLVNLLRRINPVFASLQRTDGQVTLTLTEATLPVDTPATLEATGRLDFPPQLTLARTGILADLLKISAPTDNTPVTATADTLRFRISSGLLSYDNFTLNCGRRQPLTFTGSIALAGTCNLMATVPATTTGPLSSSTADIPITGPLNNPQAHLPN